MNDGKDARRRPVTLTLLELVLVIGLAGWMTRSYFDPSRAVKLAGGEADWLTNSAWLVSQGLLDEGHVPKWQPYLEFGEPVIDNPFSFLLNPVEMLPSIIVGPAVGIRHSVILAVIVVGLGGWALGRWLGLGLLARLILAGLCMGKGNMHAMVEAGYFQLGLAQAYFPWIALGVLATLKEPKKRWAVVLTALSLSMTWWAGNIWHVLPMLLLTAILTVAHVVLKRDLLALRRVAFALLLAVGLSAVSLLPIWHNRSLIYGHADDRLAGSVVEPLRILEQFVDGDPSVYDGSKGFRERFIYYSYVVPGWAVLALGLSLLLPFRWLRFGRERDVQHAWLPLAVVFGLMVVWAAGGNPLFVWAYANVPLLGQWHYVGRALATASFCLVVLVALRIEHLWRAFYVQTGVADWLAGGTGTARLPLGLAGCLLLGQLGSLMTVQVGSAWGEVNGVTGIDSWKSGCLSWLRSQQPDRPLSVYEDGYEAIWPFLAYHVRAYNIQAEFHVAASGLSLYRSDLYALLPEYAMPDLEGSARYLLAHGFAPVLGSPSHDGFPCLYHNDEALPYAFGIPLATLEAASPLTFSKASVDVLTSFVRHLDWVALSARTTGKPYVVSIQERAYPGWRVEVDGRPAQLESVGGQVGVVVDGDPGWHAVLFVYEGNVNGAAWITVLTALLAICYLSGVDRLFVSRPAQSVTSHSG